MAESAIARGESNSISSTDLSSLNYDQSVLKSAGKNKLESDLKHAVDTTIRKCFQAIKFSILRNNYDEIYKENPECLKDVHKQLMEQIQESVMLEVNKMYNEENIENLLKSLDEIVLRHASKVGCTAWRPSGNPEQDMRDHKYALLLKQKEKLAEMLKQLDSENEELLIVFQQNQVELLQNDKELKEMSQNVEEVSEQINSTGKIFETLKLLPRPKEPDQQND